MSSNPAASSSQGSVTSQFTSNELQDVHNPLWAYVTTMQERVEGVTNKSWACNYCRCVFKSSYSRVKAHLLKLPNCGIKACLKVTNENLAEMKKLVEEVEQKLKPKNVPLPPNSSSIQHSPSYSAGGMFDSRKRKVVGAGTSMLEKSFNLATREQLKSEIARMFYSAGLPFHFARNPYYVSAFSFAANNVISGFVPPGYNALRTTLLQREKAHIESMLEPIKKTWKEKGVRIVSDGWTDAQRRPLINFMATSEGGPIFLKAIDGSKEYKDKFYMASLIRSAIVEVGDKNVVQVITDNAPVCKAAGMLIEVDYPQIFWTPCVVHTLNLALKNICAAKNTERNEIAYVECHWITETS
ncbi:DUF659 domain-containing protein [Quillaja saponaria]|uniref:DUF659 domain-containing protein n=1 Tax=Quillaja saponaria TaxID=32244 RepID=A0AAD7PR05_QUISA|nr:DUF659 domain-containing protein [Quillaja saponaria]